MTHFLLSDCWRSIPSDWKKVFLIALASNFFVFSYGMMQFPLGDHDVSCIEGVSYFGEAVLGRWFTPFLYALSGFLQIPVYTQTLAMALQIIVGMAVVLLWKKDVGFFHLLASALLVSLIPFVNEYYYFHWAALNFSFSQLFMILPIVILSQWTWLRFFISTAMIVLALATYQSSIMTFMVVFCGLVAFKVMNWDGSRSSFMQILKQLSLPVAAAVFGSILYAISLFPIVYLGYLQSPYHFQIASGPFFLRLLDVAQSAFAHLWYTQAYSPRLLKILFLFSSIVGAIGIIINSRQGALRIQAVKFGLLLLAFVAVILASKSQFLFSGYTNVYAYRFAGLSLSYVYLFFISGLFIMPAGLIKRLGIASFCLAIFVCAVNDFRAQEQLVRSNTHDFAVLNRVVARIEALDEFDPAITYNIVHFGKPKPYIASLYDQSDYDVDGVELLGRTITQTWRPGPELTILSKYLKFGLLLTERSFNGKDVLVKAVKAANNHKAFPHKSFCFITDNNILVLVFDENVVKEAASSFDF